METKLLPCPFCGGKAELYSGGIKYVLCKECLATSNDFKTEAEAIKTWNTRHERTCEITYGEHGCPYCGECGCVLYSTSGYCPNCGTRIKEDTDA